MIKRLLAALFFAFVAATSASTPARAQPAAEMQAILADLGVWMQEYQAIMTVANEPYVAMGSYLSALEQFAEGRSSASSTRRSIEEWRRNALASLSRANSAAERLRAPPSLAAYGADGVALDTIMVSIRQDLTPTLVETERSVHAVAELGLAALNDRAKGYEARAAALYQGSIRLTAVERRRIDVAAASLPANHPNQALMVATQHYYDTLAAVPTYALQEQAGGGDRAALIESLRASARGMRTALERARGLTTQLTARSRSVQGGPGVEVARVMVRMLETFPQSIAAYEGLAVGVEEAADALAEGQEVNDVWADQEDNDRPYLEEIARLEAVRAELLATNNQSPL